MLKGNPTSLDQSSSKVRMLLKDRPKFNPSIISIRTGPARQPGRCNNASDACGRLAERCPRAQECTQSSMEAKGGHPMKSYGHFINGSYVDPVQGRWIDSLNPYTGEVWARIPQGCAGDV